MKNSINMDIKQKLIAIAIAIVLVLFITIGIDTFYKAPENNCYNEIVIKPVNPNIDRNCEVFSEPNRTKCYLDQQAYYTNQSIIQQKCYEVFQPIESLYKRNVFIILTIIGVLTVIIGFLLKEMQALSLGLMIGGLVNIVVGIIRYWTNMNEYLRFIILGILLIILIWISYKKLKY